MTDTMREFNDRDIGRKINSILDRILYLGTPSFSLFCDRITKYKNEDIKIECTTYTCEETIYQLQIGSIEIYQSRDLYGSSKHVTPVGLISNAIDNDCLKCIVNYLENLAQEADQQRIKDDTKEKERQQEIHEKSKQTIMKICKKAPRIEHIIDIV